ncbi:MAG: efflux RND transporter permease subunit, partial [Myxococcota bacterium]
VASIVPLVALASLGLYAIGGGVLHQISVAALVIALGMLVDNAIVVAEAIQARIDEGQERTIAVREAVKKLAWPLATATGTTLAAFVPMYASSGPTGDFTRAIPIVIMLTLVVSYLFAVTVTPTIAGGVLRPSKNQDANLVTRFADWASKTAIARPRWVLLSAVFAVLASGFGAGFVDAAFFPKAGRNQLVVDLSLPEGTHIDRVDSVALRLERHLMDLPQVETVATFVGRSAPRFYYNLPNKPNSPHFAHLMLTLKDKSVVQQVAREVRRYNREVLPAAQIIPRPLEQGPPIKAPIEVRFFGDDLGQLYLAAEDVMRALDKDKATVDVRQDLGLGRPTLEIEIDDSAAERRGINRASVATALFQETRGIEVGQLRGGDEPVPIRIRSSAGENATAAALSALGVPSQRHSERVPLQQVARTQVRWKPAAIHRRNGERLMSVMAQLRGDAGYAAVLARLQPVLENAQWRDQVRVELGGAAEGSGDANSAIATAAPIGALLLLFFLLIEFNSFRRVGIILTTIPLAAAGVVPGLLVADQPFGFMSLLGVIALIGVVVNNAIVLIDVVESRRGRGDSIRDALAYAVRLRTRPILLTSITTIAGLMPLALSSSPLWPPLASAMIAGLLASTLLTLLVVPALYTQLFKEVPA